MTCLYYNIGLLGGVHQTNGPLRGKELANFPSISNAYLITQDERIVDFGSMQNLVEENFQFTKRIDVAGGALFPSWCDSHTHLVFAGSRESEFVDKIKGVSYAEIAAKGGGILNSAQKLQQTQEEYLFNAALDRLRELVQLGTGAIEIKSGYGLNIEDEMKMLRVIRILKQLSPIPIKSTFLGAHAIPEEFKNNKDTIEKELGLSVSKIFEIKGEDYFRRFEENITLKLLKINSTVVSLGGGAFVNKVIRKEVLKNHISFWLNWNNEILLNRIKNSKKRPLAFNSTENELIDLIKKRSNIYSKALYEIKCDKLSKSEIVKNVLKNYETH